MNRDQAGTLVVHAGILLIVASVYLRWGTTAGVFALGVYLIILGAAHQLDGDEGDGYYVE